MPPDRIYIELTSGEARALFATPTEPQAFTDVERDRARNKLRTALAPESGEEWCGGTKEIDVGEDHTGERVGSCPGCPDCQPESGEGEDWEPVVLYRRHRSVKTLMVAGSARLPDLEYRRYIPAPEGGEE